MNAQAALQPPLLPLPVNEPVGLYPPPMNHHRDTDRPVAPVPQRPSAPFEPIDLSLDDYDVYNDEVRGLEDPPSSHQNQHQRQPPQQQIQWQAGAMQDPGYTQDLYQRTQHPEFWQQSPHHHHQQQQQQQHHRPQAHSGPPLPPAPRCQFPHVMQHEQRQQQDREHQQQPPQQRQQFHPRSNGHDARQVQAARPSSSSMIATTPQQHLALQQRQFQQQQEELQRRHLAGQEQQIQSNQFRQLQQQGFVPRDATGPPPPAYRPTIAKGYPAPSFQRQQQQHQQQQPMTPAAFLASGFSSSSASSSGAPTRSLAYDAVHARLVNPNPLQTHYNGVNGGAAAGGGARGSQQEYERFRNEGPSIIFSVASGGQFSAKIIGDVPDGVISYFRFTPGARCRKKKKRWYFPLSAHNNLVVALDTIRQKLYADEKISLRVATIPPEVLQKLTLSQGRSKISQAQADAHEQLKDKIPPFLLDTLAPFQKEGVNFVVGRGGRGLIADEMGLGKTIQAIAIATVYVQEWPLLILSPSSARFHWEVELLKWLDREMLPLDAIQVITQGRESITNASKVVVISYDLALRMRDDLQPRTMTEPRFKVIIADECHYLKNTKAQRSKSILPLIANARRAILLSGTPALSRPRELWTQLNVVDGKAWSDQEAFIERYCTGGGKRGFKGKGKGAANLRELHEMLKATVMVRRCKKDILKNLPPKRRMLRTVDIPEDEMKDRLLEALQDLKLASARSKAARSGRKRKTDDLLAGLQNLPSVPGGGKMGFGGGGGGAEMDLNELQKKRKCLMMEAFKLTGIAKAEVAIERIKELLSSHLGGKMLVFAHHRNVLDAIEKGALRQVPHIRIDGSTHARDRQSQVEAFQTDPSLRVALLSLTAAGLSLTLTAASRVLFVELFWTPGALLQAEDRCHRIGQTSEVQVEYLIARGSLDDCLWPMIQRKMRVLGEVVEGAEKMGMAAEESQESTVGSSSQDSGLIGGKEDEMFMLTETTDPAVLAELAKEDRDRGEEEEEEEDEEGENYGWGSSAEESSGDEDEPELYEIVTIYDDDDDDDVGGGAKGMPVAEGEQRKLPPHRMPPYIWQPTPYQEQGGGGAAASAAAGGGESGHSQGRMVMVGGGGASSFLSSSSSSATLTSGEAVGGHHRQTAATQEYEEGDDEDDKEEEDDDVVIVVE